MDANILLDNIASRLIGIAKEDMTEAETQICKMLEKEGILSFDGEAYRRKE